MPTTHPAGDVPGSRTSDLAASRSERQRDTDDDVKRIVNLDAQENFSQLVFSTDLVQLGPHQGLFTDIVRVNEKQTLRVFRRWAAHQAALTQSQTARSSEGNSSMSREKAHAMITWIDDTKKKAGLDIRVKEQKWRRAAPLLLRTDEENSISYSMDLRGKQIASQASRDIFPVDCAF